MPKAFVAKLTKTAHFQIGSTHVEGHDGGISWVFYSICVLILKRIFGTVYSDLIPLNLFVLARKQKGYAQPCISFKLTLSAFQKV